MREDATETGPHVVWVVDDSPTERAAARHALAGQFTVRAFHDGASALERLAAGERCDVLVLDWEMSGLSGVDVCRYIRGSTADEKLPILLLTVHRDTERVVEGLEAGANDFQSKPFVPAELAARVSALLRDKLLRDRLEQVERRRAQDAEERARLQDLYLGIIGHDLRNPLAAIFNAAQLIELVELPDDERRTVAARVLNSARRMGELIEQLLDITRSRLGGGIPIRPEPGQLADICGHVVEEIRMAHAGRDVRFATRDPGDGRWDAPRIAQAVSNLLGNALQHGDPEAPVTLTLSAEGDGMAVEIHNEGSPIPEARLASLFDPFYRNAPERRASSAGLGLGLFIAQQIVRAHGGDITARSDTKGTTFRIWLPRQPAA
jgi:signal transduction histidine kinase